MGCTGPSELSHENKFFQLQLYIFTYVLHLNSVGIISLRLPVLGLYGKVLVAKWLQGWLL